MSKREVIAAPGLTLLLQGMHDDSIRKRILGPLRGRVVLQTPFPSRVLRPDRASQAILKKRDLAELA